MIECNKKTCGNYDILCAHCKREANFDYKRGYKALQAQNKLLLEAVEFYGGMSSEQYKADKEKIKHTTGDGFRYKSGKKAREVLKQVKELSNG